MAQSATSVDALVAPTSRAQHTTLDIVSRLSSLSLPDDSDMVAIPLHHGAHCDSLARLTDEILVSILEILPKHDLCSVSRLNKRYHALADAVLYNTVQWLKPELHLIFSQSLNRRPRRGSAIEGVKLAYPASELTRLISDTLEPTNSVSHTISTMSNLKTLDIAVPVGLLHSIGNLFNGPFDLACLQSCTLFYQDEADQYWDLQENIHIFTHPTLETLVIKRAKLDDRGFELIERPHNTALSKLHLIECDINDDALSDVLMFPEALKEFVLTQREEPEPELEESSASIRDYILSLKEQCHSLETITIDFPMLASARPLALREFTALKTLRLNWDYQLFGKSTKKPRLHSVGLPPELETLEFFNPLGTDEEVTDLFVSALENMHYTCRKLKELIVLVDEDPVPKEIVDAVKKQEQLYLNLSLKDTEDVLVISQQALNIPLDQKMECVAERGKEMFGYKPAGAVKQTDKDARPDTTEFFNVSKDHLLGNSESRSYPAEITDQWTDLGRFAQNCHSLGLMILRILAQQLDLPSDEFTKRNKISSVSGDHIRMTKMPGCDSADGKRIGLASHTDFGSITVLFNWVGGLQIQSHNPTKQGEWAFVKPLSGHAIINLGDAMVKFSNGRLKSGKHRVVPLPGVQGRVDRYSLVHFVRPADDVLMQPVEQYRNEPVVAVGGKVGEEKVYTAGECLDCQIVESIDNLVDEQIKE
ncbi:unnamed protein product [Fusarium fujikuroi]|uniref:F-box domain-containing protein n=1 Tax=Fusarium fujikuroi TaxID=5127 RepID=A0A9Q9RG80_FUSFU|nr:unnamed protein product [Fusarium fujikuroi]